MSSRPWLATGELRERFFAAGRYWDAEHAVLPSSGRLSPRLELAVANALCTRPEPLSGEELQFLCRVTGARNVDVAARLEASRSNVTYWMGRARTLPYWVSIALKKWFWLELFAGLLADGVAVPLATALDDRAHVEASMRRHRCGARRDVAALFHLAIERRDPAIEGGVSLAIARGHFLERHAACILRKAGLFHYPRDRRDPGRSVSTS